jgi:hypothetical protein
MFDSAGLSAEAYVGSGAVLDSHKKGKIYADN